MKVKEENATLMLPNLIGSAKTSPLQSQMLKAWPESMANVNPRVLGKIGLRRGDEQEGIVREIEKCRAPLEADSGGCSALDSEHGINVMR
jgi:hypothetical protein